MEKIILSTAPDLGIIQLVSYNATPRVYLQKQELGHFSGSWIVFEPTIFVETNVPSKYTIYLVLEANYQYRIMFGAALDKFTGIYCNIIEPPLYKRHIFANVWDAGTKVLTTSTISVYSCYMAPIIGREGNYGELKHDPNTKEYEIIQNKVSIIRGEYVT